MSKSKHACFFQANLTSNQLDNKLGYFNVTLGSYPNLEFPLNVLS